MTRYYVYTVKSKDPNERNNALVEDPFMFALHEYNPETMEFSGIFVEAQTPLEALNIYLHPSEKDVFVSCDEPKPTELKRRAYESRARLTKTKAELTEDQLTIRKLRIQTLILNIANELSRLAIRASELARLIKETSNAPNKDEFTDEQIYNKIIEKYAEQIRGFKYRPRFDTQG